MLLRRALAALLVALLVASCGDDGGASPAEDQAAADEVIAAAEQRLEAEGFSPDEDDDDDDEEIEFTSEQCKRFNDALPRDDEDLPGETASAETADFERGELAPRKGVQETVQVSVGFVEEEDDLDVVFELLNDPELPDCLTEAFSEFMERSAAEQGVGFEASDFVAERVDAPDLGDEAAALRLSGNLAAEGFEFSLQFDVDVVRVGRAAAISLYGSVASGDSDATHEDRLPLLEAVVDDLAEHG